MKTPYTLASPALPTGFDSISIGRLSNLFAEKAIDLLFNGSNGIPRLINILAHKALMIAFRKGDRILTDKHIELAVADTESAQQRKLGDRRLFST
jgi:hypothetical protein